MQGLRDRWMAFGFQNIERKAASLAVSGEPSWKRASLRKKNV